MKKHKNITFKVWLEIERLNEKTGKSEDMDAPGSSLATFATYEEARDYAEHVTSLASTARAAIAKVTDICPPSDPGRPPLIIRSGETAAADRIIVPAGSPLIAGRLYLHLYHGRQDTAEHMDDWGFQGPTFGPLASVGQTYLTHVRLYGDDDVELWLETRDDMIVWQGSYYGDMSVFIATPDDHG